MFSKLYYYGEGTDHIVRLTEAQADAANKILLYPVEGQPGVFKTNLTDREMKHYNVAADKLNAYIASCDERSGPYASDEYLEKHDLLRPVR